MFEDLGVVKEDVKETYLVAFLACWFYKFVLLGEGVNLIHPKGFKVVSRMVQGKTISLVVSILASIYNGLNEITCFSKLEINASIFPIHYLYRWLG